MNGELVDWADAKVHVGVHGLHYGTGVFEGIRCYETPDGPAVFRLREHLERLDNSAKLLYMELPFSTEELRSATPRAGRSQRARRVLPPPVRVLRLRRARRAHEGQSGRGRDHELAVGRTTSATRTPPRASAARSRPGSGSAPNTIPHVAKATGIYLNSMLAVHEAQAAGYDEAILLTDDGFVADGSGENIFVDQGREDLDAAAVDLDPARDHARQRSSRSPRTSATSSRRRASSAPTSISPTRSS